ncbi:MAG: RNA polymerase sigma factor [Candidatus Zixiibacteriota bacterium]|nr:MAG: RNA polymerase sigma factor [candidate division Zixibacteria bacterium]
MSSEWDYFIRAQRGDELAWRVLIGQHQTRLTALALFITGSATAAEDVVQETFLRAISAKIKSYTGTVNGYLGTIAYRLALKEVKREKRNVGFDGLTLTDREYTQLDSLLLDERDHVVSEAINSLDEMHRAVLLLRFYGGCSYEEIAELLQIAIGTVKSRLFHAVKSCREILQEKGISR